MKRNQYLKNYGNCYFWRTKEQQEIDYIEEKDGQMDAYEFKWNSNKKVKFTKTFNNAYPNATTQVITSENFASFLI